MIKVDVEKAEVSENVEEFEASVENLDIETAQEVYGTILSEPEASLGETKAHAIKAIADAVEEGNSNFIFAMVVLATEAIAMKQMAARYLNETEEEPKEDKKEYTLDQLELRPEDTKYVLACRSMVKI